MLLGVVSRFGIKGHLDMVGVTVESPYSHNQSLYESKLLMQQHPEFYLFFFLYHIDNYLGNIPLKPDRDKQMMRCLHLKDTPS